MNYETLLPPEAEAKLPPGALGPLPLILLRKETSGHDPTPPSPFELRTINEDGTWGRYMDRSDRRFVELMQKHVEDQPAWLVEGIHVSLMNLHATRCERNAQAYQEYQRRTFGVEVPEETQRLWDKALVGMASKVELLKLHQQADELSSIEIAKESHPCSWDTEKMDNSVKDAIKEHDVHAEWLYGPDNCRYAFHRILFDDQGEAVGIVIVRKRNVAMLGEDEMVVKRSTFVIKLGEELPEELHGLRELLKQSPTSPEDRDELKEKVVAMLLAAGREDRAREFLARIEVRNQMPKFADVLSRRLADDSEVLEDGIHKRAGWLAPVASSYFVRRASNKSEAKSDKVKNYYPAARQVGALAVGS